VPQPITAFVQAEHLVLDDFATGIQVACVEQLAVRVPSSSRRVISTPDSSAPKRGRMGLIVRLKAGLMAHSPGTVGLCC
jgi:hypothetical protein